MKRAGKVIVGAVLLLAVTAGSVFLPGEISKQYDKKLLAGEFREEIAEPSEAEKKSTVVEKIDLISRCGYENNVAKSTWKSYYTSAYEDLDESSDIYTDMLVEDLEHGYSLNNSYADYGKASKLLKPGLIKEVTCELEKMQKLGIFPKTKKLNGLKVYTFGVVEFLDRNNIDAYVAIGELMVGIEGSLALIDFDIETGQIYQYNMTGEVCDNLKRRDMRKGLQTYLGLTPEEIRKYYFFESYISTNLHGETGNYRMIIYYTEEW